MMTQLATFGGGCFWCTEAVFEQVDGVARVVSGYAGGHVPSPTYEAVCSKTTGHAEVVQLTFDPERITYRELLEIFFATHDPTTIDRQGNDKGPQYRSIVLTHDAAQRADVEDVIAELTEERAFGAPIVTEIRPFEEFWPAEAEHQHYYARNPEQGYCAFVISPKLAKFRTKFADRLKASWA
jgi:peptide-methionine (S)-S-oxide reductase